MLDSSILIISALFTAGLIMLLRRTATRAGLVDHPCERKNHLGSIPIHGGVCMALVILAAASVQWLITGLTSAEWVLVLGIGFFALVGVLDDLRDLPAMLRLILEVAFLFWLMTAFDFRITHLGDLWGAGDIQLGWLSVPFTLFTIFCLINGINMLDGMDGLAGGIATIAVAWFLMAFGLAAITTSSMLWVVMGTLLGFLFFNARAPWRSRATVFMGDAGSLVLGFVLSWCCVVYSQTGIDGGSPLVRPITAVWILALPIIDTVYVVIHRLRTGRGIFTPGSDHIHFRLQQMGYSEVSAVRLLWVVSAVLGGFGLAADQFGIPDWVMCYGFLILSTGYYFKASGMQNMNVGTTD